MGIYSKYKSKKNVAKFTKVFASIRKKSNPKEFLTGLKLIINDDFTRNEITNSIFCEIEPNAIRFSQAIDEYDVLLGKPEDESWVRNLLEYIADSAGIY